MKKSIDKKINKRKQKIRKKTKKRNWKEQQSPMLQASNIHYEMDGRRYQGIAHGGIGVIGYPLKPGYFQSFLCG